MTVMDEKAETINASAVVDPEIAVSNGVPVVAASQVEGMGGGPGVPVSTGVPVMAASSSSAVPAATPVPVQVPQQSLQQTMEVVQVPQQTVEVVAPTALQGGYQFHVDAGAGKSLLVQVPNGGVAAGQRFSAIVVSEAQGGGHDIPHGRWRDELCDCCQFGCCHPHCCLTFWCSLCGLGQVLTRHKLNAIASPLADMSSGGLTAFKIMVIITISYFVLSIIFSLAELPNPWGIILFVFAWIVTTRARAYMRQKYSIPHSCCGNICDDICCAFWCQSCTICQMGRHSADYRKYPAACCSDTGLNPDAPEVV